MQLFLLNHWERWFCDGFLILRTNGLRWLVEGSLKNAYFATVSNLGQIMRKLDKDKTNINLFIWIQSQLYRACIMHGIATMTVYIGYNHYKSETRKHFLLGKTPFESTDVAA